MNIGRKLMIIVVTSVALVTIPAALGIYEFTKKKLLATEISAQQAETKALVLANTQKISSYESGLKALARTLNQALSAPPMVGEDQMFDRLMQLDADGAWRSNPALFNGEIESGIFIAPNTQLNAKQKSLYIRTKFALDAFASSITTPTGNIWVITRDKSEIVYDRLYPNYIALMQANTDYNNMPWMSLGNMADNPQREVKWTAPSQDPTSKNWVISAVLPLDLNGKWIGSIGRDIGLTKESLSIFQHNNRYKGEQHFLVDTKQNFIESGPWQDSIDNNQNQIGLYLANEPSLKKLFESKTIDSTIAHEEIVTMQGNDYIATSMVLPVIGWKYYRLVPIDEVLSPIRSIFYSLTLMVLGIGLLIGALISFFTERYIVSRVKKLATSIHQYSSGALQARTNIVIGDDELALASQEFETLASQLESTLQAIPDILFDLDLNGRYHAIHSPDEQLLNAPAAELLNKTVSKTLPHSASVTIMSALHEADEQGWSRGKQYQSSTPKGELWFELSVAKKENSDSQNPHFVVLSRDITERKLAEHKLQESEYCWKFAIEGTGDGVWDWNIKTDQLVYSDRWRHLFGYSEEDHLPTDHNVWRSLFTQMMLKWFVMHWLIILKAAPANT